MKKTTKRLSINKETVVSFSSLSEKEMNEAKGGGSLENCGTGFLTWVSLCMKCLTVPGYSDCGLQQY